MDFVRMSLVIPIPLHALYGHMKIILFYSFILPLPLYNHYRYCYNNYYKLLLNVFYFYLLFLLTK